MAKTIDKEKAQKMRTTGKSIGEIALLLNVSKSTVSSWCRDISLSDEQIEKIAKRSNHRATAALLRTAEKKRETRRTALRLAEEKAKEKVGKLSSRDIYLIGLGLYWGEGYKKGSQEFGFTNSDSNMIKFYLHWLNDSYGVVTKDLILRISINELHRNRISEVTNYWIEKTGVPLTQFTKPSFIKTRARKTFSNKNQHYGTLRVKVRKGTQYRREVLAAISFFR